MIDKILKYQEIDERAKAVEHALQTSDEWRKYGQSRKFLKTASERLDRLDAKAGELVKLSEEFGKRYLEMEQELKEFDGTVETEDLEVVNFYKKNAARLTEQIRNLKNNMQNVMDEAKAVAAEFEELRKNTILMQRQYNEYREKYRTLKEQKDTEIKEIEKLLIKEAKHISPELLEKYKAKRADKLFPILYEINDKRCRQCGMELSLSDLSNLKREKIIECENCRHLVYIKE